jgi:hypothetical protein
LEGKISKLQREMWGRKKRKKEVRGKKKRY